MRADGTRADGFTLVELLAVLAIMALITACILDQHLYFAMNAPKGVTGGTAQSAAEYTNTKLGLSGPPTSAEQLQRYADGVDEQSLISRTGGAPTLAMGMSETLQRAFGGDSLRSFWYHFAIMFEALFILTTVDAGTRVARFMLSDGLSNIKGAKRFADPSWRVGAWICTLIVVAGWGSILLMGVTDPLGGINTLFPLFGIANQLLAAIALTVVLVVVMKKGKFRWAWIPGVPLVWDLAVTMTASYQKIFSSNPAIGYWQQHSDFVAARDSGQTTFRTAKTAEEIDAVIRNTFIQGTLSIVFAVLVLIVAAVGLWVCIRAVRAGGLPTTEVEPVPSHLFAPSGLVTTPAERAVAEQWREYEKTRDPLGARRT